ncbi:hypothetical protein [Allorhizocola rhizosphaerae]|uniref:hypothetical protein n=1 Tax=Allorhizocola rhizosphaerae TaxID=1872709 RepID=UPI000E3DF17E|nr:hypothetical protein [Allorhizocola rhizosphaerae]
MTTLLVARIIGIAVSAGTFVFLFIGGSWRPDNPFLVPDLILCGLLVAAALVPARIAATALIFAFGLTAGVLMSAAASYLVTGRLGAASLLGAITAIVMGGVLVRHQLRATA